MSSTQSTSPSQPLGISPTEAIATPRLILVPFQTLMLGPDDAHPIPSLQDDILEKLHTMTTKADLFRSMPLGPFPTKQDFHTFFTQTYPQQNKGVMYAVKLTRSGEIIGGVGFQQIRDAPPFSGLLEIGPIFVDQRLQGQGFGPEIAAAMVRHAIEVRGYQRVEWKAHHTNTPSHKCALKVGFVHEGTFRRQMMVRGAPMNTFWFSLTAEEYFVAQEGEPEPKQERILRLLDTFNTKSK